MAPIVNSESQLVRENGIYEPSSNTFMGYSYSVLEQQVGTILNSLVENVLPGENETYTSRIGGSSDKMWAARLEKALRTRDAEKQNAENSRETAEKRTQELIESKAKVELYVQVLEAMKSAVNSVSGPNEQSPISSTSKPVQLPALGNKQQSTTASAVGPRKSSLYGRPNAANKGGRTKAPAPKKQFVPITEEEFMNVSSLVRGKVKLSDVNHAFAVLFHAFVEEGLRTVKMTELAQQRGVEISGATHMAKIKVLRALRRINLSADMVQISPGSDF